MKVNKRLGMVVKTLYCGNVRYNTHLYCLAVQASLYSDVVECWLRMLAVPGSILCWGKRCLVFFTGYSMMNYVHSLKAHFQLFRQISKIFFQKAIAHCIIFKTYISRKLNRLFENQQETYVPVFAIFSTFLAENH